MSSQNPAQRRQTQVERVKQTAPATAAAKTQAHPYSGTNWDTAAKKLVEPRKTACVVINDALTVDVLKGLSSSSEVEGPHNGIQQQRDAKDGKMKDVKVTYCMTTLHVLKLLKGISKNTSMTVHRAKGDFGMHATVVIGFTVRIAYDVPKKQGDAAAKHNMTADNLKTAMKRDKALEGTKVKMIRAVDRQPTAKSRDGHFVDAAVDELVKVKHLYGKIDLETAWVIATNQKMHVVVPWKSSSQSSQG